MGIYNQTEMTSHKSWVTSSNSPILHSQLSIVFGPLAMVTEKVKNKQNLRCGYRYWVLTFLDCRDPFGYKRGPSICIVVKRVVKPLSLLIGDQVVPQSILFGKNYTSISEVQFNAKQSSTSKFSLTRNIYWHLAMVYTKRKWFVIPLSRRYFGNWVTEMSNSSLLKQ